MRYMVKSGLRHFEWFAAVFLAARVVLDLVTAGWGGVDLAAAWSSVGSYLPVWFAAWFVVWGVLTAADAAQRRQLRAEAESVEGDV